MLNIRSNIVFCIIFAFTSQIYICFAISYCSTKGLGGTALDPSKAQELEDGLVVPLGKPKTESGKKVCTRS